MIMMMPYLSDAEKLTGRATGKTGAPAIMCYAIM